MKKFWNYLKDPFVYMLIGGMFGALVAWSIFKDIDSSQEIEEKKEKLCLGYLSTLITL